MSPGTTKQSSISDIFSSDIFWASKPAARLMACSYGACLCSIWDLRFGTDHRLKRHPPPSSTLWEPGLMMPGTLLRPERTLSSTLTQPFSLSLLHYSRDNNVKGVIAECQNHPEICIISNGQTNCRTRPHLRDQIINRAGSEGGDAAASIEVQYIRCGVSSQRCVINDVKTGRGGLVVLHSGRYYLGLFF